MTFEISKFNVKTFYLFLVFLCFIVLVHQNRDQLLLNYNLLNSPIHSRRPLEEGIYNEGKKEHPLENIQGLKENEKSFSKNSAFLVNTPKCKIVRWRTIDQDVRPLIKNHTNHEMPCEKKFYNISIERIDFNGIAITNKLNKTIWCYAQRVVRDDDSSIELGEKIWLNTNNITYFNNDIAVLVNCTINEDNEEFVKVVPLVPDPKLRQTDAVLPNILMIGIDSVSRLNFDRHFVRTARLIADHNFYTLYGYNKVGDNTFPNLTPLLTGFYPEDIWKEKLGKHFDYFPFIWKNYRQRGYQTYYMEDAPNMNTFNYAKPGFKDAPTDYYLRTYCKAMDDQVKDFCYLGQPATQVYFDYLYDFISSMNKHDQRYFVFHFMAKLTHDYLNNAGYMDLFVYNLLERLFQDNLLKDTIVIFFSDHGIRFGEIRETLSGKYEERLPFAHIHVPKEWRNQNLSINQNRLTSPFDIHATLKHILFGIPDRDLKHGETLFEEIPENRSCSDIPISEHWCGCQTSRVIKNLTAIAPLSKFIVQQTNQMLSPVSDRCVELLLNRTLSATEQTLSDKVLSFKKCKTTSDTCVDSSEGVFSNETTVLSTKHYLITVGVEPSGALFEATVDYNPISGNMSIVGDISRINLYGNQSHCIESASLKKYCLCRDFIQ